MAKKFLQLGNILKRLLFEKNIKAADLARDLNIPAPTIHRIITGKSTRPYISSLKPIADYFALSIDELTGEKPFNINQGKNSQNLQSIIHHIPLISWENSTQNQLNDESKHDIVPFFGKLGNGAFATMLEDSSMEPLFPRGSLLIFDPQKPFKDRSYVLIQPHETSAPVFRQLLVDFDQKYMKPLNPDLNVFKMRLIGKKDRIVATLIEARQVY